MNIDQLKQNWEAFGRRDPLWAILTQPDKKGGKWQAEEFFCRGKQEIDGVLDYLKSLPLNHVLKLGSALDFGCGIGRLTQALCVPL
jgi:hypothetical protein